mgnify:CR=1 FL=1
MPILADATTRVLVQGITGREGSFHTAQMIDYGTSIVAGVTPGRGGEWIHSTPVFDTVQSAIEATGANTSVIFVPPSYAVDAIYEAADAGIKLIICITEGIPVFEMMKARHYLKSMNSRLIGANCPGILLPGYCSIGIIPWEIAKEGGIGVVSKSGALSYDVVNMLSTHGLGQSAIVGIGGDPVLGTSFVDVLEMFENDPDTSEVVLLGEIGGSAEVEAANYIKHHMTKRVTAFIAGQTAPQGTRMGHAGAIIEGGRGTAQEKIDALNDAGARVAKHPEQILDIIRELT